MNFNIHNKMPDVEILQQIDVNNIEWCDEAVLICVKNGKGTLIHKISEDDEYMHYSQLLLNDKPIIQAKYPICPTCAGMLATGYGIENINSEELIKARECMNSEYKGIMNSAESLKPLLGLLTDGYYVLADVKLYPSDGQGNFFYSVPNELTHNEAFCSEYYDLNFMCSLEGFPAYIYPTQSSELINTKRVDEYTKLLKNSANPPRGLAYYEAGFICALLDGHHKACAASVLGKKFNCLTIIPLNRYEFLEGAKYAGNDTLIKNVGFAGIVIDVERGAKIKDYLPIKGAIEKKIHKSVYNLTGRKFPEKYINTYPTIHTLSHIINAKVDISGDVVEYAKTLISLKDEESVIKLDYLMKYLSEYGKKEAYIVAKMILDQRDEYIFKSPRKSAIKELMNHRNEETEQYMIDYIVNHDSEDQCWHLVNSYWD
ncbi:MAG: hypothetical protein U0L20_00935 [Ruminococcus sp.]|nr:hypothetical protein [Ruminococcus sp.]